MRIVGAEGRGDRPVRRRSRFTLARARAEPLVLLGHIEAVGQEAGLAGSSMSECLFWIRVGAAADPRYDRSRRAPER
jgi:hypothetical protein